MFNKRLLLWILIIFLGALFFLPFVTVVPENISPSEEPKVVEKKTDWYQEAANASGRLSLAIKDFNSARFAVNEKNLTEEQIQELLLIADSLKGPTNQLKKATEILMKNKDQKDSGNNYPLFFLIVGFLTLIIVCKKFGKKKRRR